MEKLLSAEVWGYRKQIQFTWQRSDGNSLLVTFLEFSAKLALFKEMKECWVNRKWAFFQTYCPTQKMFHQQNVNWIRIQNILFHDSAFNNKILYEDSTLHNTFYFMTLNFINISFQDSTFHKKNYFLTLFFINISFQDSTFLNKILFFTTKYIFMKALHRISYIMTAFSQKKILFHESTFHNK